MLDRILSVVVSVLLGFLVWLYARSRDQDTLDNVPITVHIALAPGQAAQYDLGDVPPTQIPVSFTGPPSRIRELRTRLQNGDIKAVVTLSIPEAHLQESKYTETVRILPRHIHTPPGVKPTVVEGQNRVPVTYYRVVERELKVQLEPARELRMTNVVVEPPKVLVRGPQELLDKLRTFPTQSFSVPEGDEPATEPRTITTKPIPLVEKMDGSKVWTTPPTVTARFTIQPQQKLYTLEDIPVQFLCPSGFDLRPLFDNDRAGKITLKLSGPHSEELPAVVAFVDLSGQQKKLEPGLYNEAVKLHLPKDYRIVGEPPGTVSFQLVSGTANGREGVVPEN